MASKLNTDIHGIYNLPYYEYAYYIQFEEERIKKKQEQQDNIKHQEKYELIRGSKGMSIKSADFPNSVNLPEDLK